MSVLHDSKIDKNNHKATNFAIYSGGEKSHKIETLALIKGLQIVSKTSDFKEAAQMIFNSCNKLLRVQAGYITLLSDDKKTNEIIFLDAGDMNSSIKLDLTMPIRGLKEMAYKTGKVVYVNNFSTSKWTKFLPLGHVNLKNVLFSPLLLQGETVGLMGLGNKPNGFSKKDIRLILAFSELISLALQNIRSSEKLSNNEEHLRFLTQNASDAIISTDINFNIVFWNEAAEIIFGYSAEEILNKSLNIIIPETNLNSLYEKLNNKDYKETKINTITRELIGLNKDGKEFTIEASFSQGQIGLHSYLTTIIRDVTKRKQSEKEQYRFQQLNLIAQMAAGISHEIRNPMTTVRGFLQFLMYKSEFSQNKSYFQLMIDEIDKANSVITEFLSLSQTEANNLKLWNMKKLIDFILPSIIIESCTPHEIKVELEDTPDLYLDEEEIRKLLVNLVRNGLESMAPAGVLKIKLYTENKEVVLAVEDQGQGIDPENIAKITNPFFTTKDYGTGLGLAICNSIAARHNARIEVKTGTFGTTIFVRFQVKS